MLQEVIELQDQAVKGLLAKTKVKDEITFKSPTGSGKTYMMADFMNRILSATENIIFLVSSLSKGDLAKQNYEKFVQYSDEKTFEHINPYLISSETSGEGRLYIPTDYNVYVLPRDLYKDKSKLKQGALANFLRAITSSNPLGMNKKVYVIKDECHIATTNLDSLAKDYFTKVYNCSATPNLKRGQKPDVELKELDAVNTHLIKAVEYHDEDEDLSVALDKYEELKKQYNELIGINPCMIIQISNKDKADNEIKRIRAELDKRPDLKWMLIVDKDKDCDTNDVFKCKKVPVNKWKDYAKTNTATIDIIIFKMVITEGWDIPRACILYQVRDSKSKQLDEQVVGRVRRNPCLTIFEKLTPESKALISTAHVWGLRPEEAKALHEVRLVGGIGPNKVQEELKIRTTRIKKPLESTTFDIEAYLSTKTVTAPHNIFDLHKKCSKATNEVKDLYTEYVDSINKWFAFAENIDVISTKIKDIVCDYSQNMELAHTVDGIPIEASFPLISYYTDNANYKNIGNWVWQRTDANDCFAFDSEAEKEWADILVNLILEDAPNGIGRLIKSVSLKDVIDGEQQTVKKYMVGKNFFANSEIKFEYYLNGIKSSYPDFIMKDWKDRIHIFEVKSLNKTTDSMIDADEYKDKVNALKDAYLYASRLTDYYFYIPIKDGLDWIILQYHNGNVETLSQNTFLKFVKH